MDPTANGMSPESMFVVSVVGFLGLVLVIWVVTTKNKFVRLRNHVRESWADVDVVLKRRHDLIPNLVATAKAYAQYEQETLLKVVQARDEALSADGEVTEVGKIEGKLDSALHQFMVRAEAYPQLKADQQFLALQDELADTEDRIAAARRFYNANVREFNTAIQTFPSSLLAGGRSQAEYFQVDDATEREAPRV